MNIASRLRLRFLAFDVPADFFVATFVMIFFVVTIGIAPWAVVGAAERIEDVAFRSTFDDSEQRYAAIFPDGFDDKRRCDVLIALHGHGSDRWQFVRQSRDECRGARDAAKERGMLFVSPDYRAKTSWMGPAAEADVRQIIGELRARYTIGHVVISGGSMGGTGALTFAALHPDLVAGVVALNGTANLVDYANFQDAIAASFGGTREQKPNEYRRRSAEFFPERFVMPLAVTTGGLDRSVPPESVLRLAKAVRARQEQVLVLHREKGGHSTDYADTLAAHRFVLERLPKTQ